MKARERYSPVEKKQSRRAFLRNTGGGLSFALVFGPTGISALRLAEDEELDIHSGRTSGEAGPGMPAAEHEFGAWVKIATDGNILIYNPAAEMGQGSMTALPVILAEEMDADWDRVRIEHSPVEPDIYGRSWGRGGGGTMMTVGSFAVRGYFRSLRLAGARIRRVLLDNVAREWDVPVGDLSTEPSIVVHSASGRRISYGEIASFAQVPAKLPAVSESALKSPRDFRLIGHSVPRHDIPAKTDGSAQYGLDVQVPGMLYAMIVRSPVHDGSPTSFNEAEIQAEPGIVATVRLEHGVGVIGETVEDVTRARQRLKIEWGGAEADGFDSEVALARYPQIVGDARTRARTISEQGDVPSALTSATRRYNSDFFNDYVYHAQLEPLNAVAWVNEAGDGAEVWAGTQAADGARSAAARALGVPTERVTFHPCYLGGGLGRRSNSDYVIEAVQLSQAIRRPVKLIWTREDDIQYGMFRPMCLQRLGAGVDSDGNVTAWTHTVVGDGDGLLASGIEIPFYSIPHQRIASRAVSHGVRTKHWRAVGHGPNKFAIEAFVDEIAEGESVDPLQFRQLLLRESPRALKVLNAVARMSDWGGEVPDGRARGLAFGERSGALAAGVAEISLDGTNGQIRVHRFWCAVDGGIIVQPDNATAQIEGGIITGLSSVLYERVTVRDGRVQQANFNSYSMMRMSDAPEIEVQFVDSIEPPAGLGEASLPVTGGAVANAFAALTGRRIRHMPFTRDRVLEAID